MLGNYVFIPVLGWQTLQLTHSATSTAIVETAAMVPMALFLLFGGVAADRLPRRLIMLLSDSGSGIAVLCISLLSWMHQLQFWHLVVLVTFFGCCSGFFSPAYRSIRPQLVEKELLASANALDGLSRQIGRLIGPSLSIVLIAFAGLPIVFAFDGLTFLFSAICLLIVRIPTTNIEPESAVLICSVRSFSGRWDMPLSVE
jgi:MFS family permease